jgi:hypothetical protein
MDRIYMSKIGDSTNPNAIAEGYIDNVAFTLHFPPETTVTGTTQVPAPPATSPTGTIGGTLPSGERREPIPLPLPVTFAALVVSLFCAGRARSRNR